MTGTGEGWRRAAVLLAITAVIAMVGPIGCSDSSGGDGAATARQDRSTTTEPTRAASTTAPTSGSATTADVAPTTPATTPTTVTQVGWPTAGEAARHLLTAWRAADRGNASQGAEPPAVDGLFAVPRGPVVDRGCDTGEFDTSGCQYRVAGGGLQLNMERRPQGWVVTEAVFTPA